MDLDELDMKILSLLQEDGRMSFAEISRRLNVNENTVRFRFSRLLNRGVIRKIVALIDPRMIGINQSAALMLKIDPEKMDDVLKELREMREIPNIYQLSGDYDAIVVVMARDMNELHGIVSRIKKIKGVTEVNTLVTIRIVKSEVKFSLTR
ncbi:MAG TPA: Lrp/AsnC family transcriptional regulator [Candidatus Caldiarchaeum subterraneum]|uniref:Lrp/AsnC family transcriptional regulator n=1 Tax=Caldiarchaeum subterraneum TaxID=311458 RepID=A0A833EA93_CALS0|nr:Lrp/AsnC family transcriptional regulator [Candidatus Caldarchaeum subterraneum]